MTIITTPEILHDLAQRHARVLEEVRGFTEVTQESASKYACLMSLQNALGSFFSDSYEFPEQGRHASPQCGHEAILLVETTGGALLKRLKLGISDAASKGFIGKQIGWTSGSDGIRETLVGYAY